jgi:uncharacterized DUF497 family protein
MFHYEWDRRKAETNIRKHGISFADAVSVFEDDYAITIQDELPDENRYIIMGKDSRRRLLVVIFSFRMDKIRIISARKATGSEHETYKRDIL